jgi:Enoyl-(Acyl carrier protein) reductase
MVERGRGVIVMVSSAITHDDHGPLSFPLVVAKGAVEAAARVLARELGPHGVQVNVVAPALTLTDKAARIPEPAKQAAVARTPLGRNANPDDVAGAITLLASDLARFVTGARVPADGGLTLASWQGADMATEAPTTHPVADPTTMRVGAVCAVAAAISFAVSGRCTATCPPRPSSRPCATSPHVLGRPSTSCSGQRAAVAGRRRVARGHPGPRHPLFTAVAGVQQAWALVLAAQLWRRANATAAT